MIGSLCCRDQLGVNLRYLYWKIILDIPSKVIVIIFSIKIYLEEDNAGVSKMSILRPTNNYVNLYIQENGYNV